MTNSVLQSLLDATACQQPEYQGDLSNHLPMALHALASMGVDGASLRRFADTYLQRSGVGVLAPSGSRLDHWPSVCGQMDAYASLRATFAAAIAQHGREAALCAALPDLWPGIAGAAFHGVIRVAHAWEAGHDGELAAALAYWAARWQWTAGVEVARTMPLGDWLSAAESAAVSWTSDRFLITERMAEVTGSSAFQSFATRLKVTHDGALHAAAWAARLYAETGNFTILHVVTGLRALQVLGHLVEPPPEVWDAVFAAIHSSGITGRQPLEAEARPWADLAAAVGMATDEHVIKLVHACSQLDALRPDPAFRLAATAALA